jgi:hypothetical protein
VEIMSELRFALSYEGLMAERHRIDLYDVSQALIGFQRSLALTTHLVLNDQIITQAPSLKNAVIHAYPPEEGSWKMVALVASTTFALGTAQNNSPLGHLLFSMYDYVISASLGFHVDYNKSLAVQYEELQKSRRQQIPTIKEHQADSLIEKIHRAVVEMHRPIVTSGSADRCVITGGSGGEERPIRVELNFETFEFINETITTKTPNTYSGRVSSYNTNTFKGRIYIAEFGRPVAFELQVNCRSNRVVQDIATSLFHSGLKQWGQPGATIHIVAFANTSRSGTLKSLTIVKVSSTPF